jgi:hypothetical protein
MPLNWTIAFPTVHFPLKLSYHDQFFLIGSCFTEHIGKYLSELKFHVTQNPAGILFDPHSIAYHLSNWAQEIYPVPEEWFCYNELWHHWKYHSQFSTTQKNISYEQAFASSRLAIQQLKTADWLIITLGSSYSYRLSSNAPQEQLQLYREGYFVANCHKCPAQWFEKYLTPSSETYELLYSTFEIIKQVNPKIHFLLNISPVRHLRDGVIENNRSKARLIEAVHLLVENRPDTFYLPSYELVIDVLRDYRFFDIDKAHPNYEATQWVLQYFLEHYFSKETQEIIEKVKEIVSAYQHKPKNPDTQAHKNFMKTFYQKTCELQKHFPFLDWRKELEYFNHEESYTL